MRSRTGRFETGAGTFGHEALGGISSPAGSCVWCPVGLHGSVREWAVRQGWGWPAGAPGAGAGDPGGSAGGAGGTSRIHRGQAGILKTAYPVLHDRFQFKGQKSVMATATPLVAQSCARDASAPQPKWMGGGPARPPPSASKRTSQSVRISIRCLLAGPVLGRRRCRMPLRTVASIPAGSTASDSVKARS